MNIGELRDLVDQKIKEKGLDLEVTTESGWNSIKDIDYCTGCNQFHIITERKFDD